MFLDIENAIVTRLTSMLVEGGPLEGVTSVKGGPTDPKSVDVTDFPYIDVCVMEDDVLTASPVQDQLQAQVILFLHTIAEGPTAPREAKEQAEGLLWSSDRQKGLIAALKVRSGYVTSDGHSFLVEPSTKHQRMMLEHAAGYTFGIKTSLKVKLYA